MLKAGPCRFPAKVCGILILLRRLADAEPGTTEEDAKAKRKGANGGLSQGLKSGLSMWRARARNSEDHMRRSA
jgi:hypothetical protein